VQVDYLRDGGKKREGMAWVAYHGNINIGRVNNCMNE
jgi:hypothetical protein